MKVLVACEYSGAVRDAFIARGHDAMSCGADGDLLALGHVFAGAIRRRYWVWALRRAVPRG